MEKDIKAPDLPGTLHEETIPSAMAFAGHPLHAMTVHFPIALVFATLGVDLFWWFTADPFWLRVGVWSSGFAFGTGVAAGVIGTFELLLVAQIRQRLSSWTHAVMAMMLISIMGLNWGLRLQDDFEVLPHGLLISAFAGIFTGLAGWHGGNLIFHHGFGVMVESDDEEEPKPGRS